MNSIKAKCFVYRFCPTNRCMEIVTSARIIRMICINNNNNLYSYQSYILVKHDNTINKINLYTDDL